LLKGGVPVRFRLEAPVSVGGANRHAKGAELTKRASALGSIPARGTITAEGRTGTPRAQN
jgi:hypothetical protein